MELVLKNLEYGDNGSTEDVASHWVGGLGKI